MIEVLKKRVYFLLFILPLLVVPQLIAQSTCTLNGKQVPCDALTKQAGNFIGFVMIVIFIITIFGIAASIFWLLMLIHAATHPIENKTIWIILIVFTHLLGALIYYFIVKKKVDIQTATISTPTTTPPLPQPQSSPPSSPQTPPSSF